MTESSTPVLCRPVARTYVPERGLPEGGHGVDHLSASTTLTDNVMNKQRDDWLIPMVDVYSHHFMSLIDISVLAYSISISLRKVIVSPRNFP